MPAPALTGSRRARATRADPGGLQSRTRRYRGGTLRPAPRAHRRAGSTAGGGRGGSRAVPLPILRRAIGGIGHQDYPEHHCIVTYESFECGYITGDGHEEHPCPYGPNWPTPDEFTFEAVPQDKLWTCYPMPKTDRARRVNAQRSVGRTKEAAEEYARNTVAPRKKANAEAPRICSISWVSLADFEFVDLFHGTSSHFVKDVFEQGLLPGRAREGKWNTGWSARADLVYLTDYGAAYYAVMSAARMPEEWQAKHIPVILKIAIEDTTCLFPDEDFIRECLKHPATPALADIARTKFRN